jgi:triacylglycerol esterase/lipase EstA (alpha/beta hydrolase family)
MLARMLRFTMALQMMAGAALGFWLSSSVASAWTPLNMVLTAIALPVAFTVLADLYSATVSRAQEPASQWWRALAGECLAGIQVFLLRQPWAFATPAIAPATNSADRIPVVLVHGYVCNYRIWDALIPDLRAQGHAVLAINLEPVFASIDDYPAQIEKAVQTLRLKTNQDKVALVGHSMGGLAIRAWLRRYGTAHVARAITLGTPHAGTQINALIRTPNALQMAWQSNWLHELAASETNDTRSLFRIALTPQDNIVFPQRAQTLEGISPVVFDGLGHVQLCTSARVRAWVCGELRLT